MTLLELPKSKTFKVSSLPSNKAISEQLIAQGFTLQ